MATMNKEPGLPPVFARGDDGPARKRGEIPNRPLTQGQVWVSLCAAFKKRYPEGHIVRIENWVGERGMPDVYFRKPWASGWLEIKTGHQKPTDLQLVWHARERKAGGAVVVLTIRPDGAIIDAGKGPTNLGVTTWSRLAFLL